LGVDGGICFVGEGRAPVVSVDGVAEVNGET
jgi:hypothetical protein